MAPSQKPLDKSQRWLLQQHVDALIQDLRSAPQGDNLVASLQLHIERLFHQLRQKKKLSSLQQHGWSDEEDLDFVTTAVRDVMMAYGNQPFVRQLVYSYLFLSLEAIRQLPEAIFDGFAAPARWCITPDMFCYIVSSLELCPHLLDSLLWLPSSCTNQLPSLLPAIIPGYHPLTLQLLACLWSHTHSLTPFLCKIITRIRQPDIPEIDSACNDCSYASRSAVQVPLTTRACENNLQATSSADSAVGPAGTMHARASQASPGPTATAALHGLMTAAVSGADAQAVADAAKVLSACPDAVNVLAEFKTQVLGTSEQEYTAVKRHDARCMSMCEDVSRDDGVDRWVRFGLDLQHHVVEGLLSHAMLALEGDDNVQEGERGRAEEERDGKRACAAGGEHEEPRLGGGKKSRLMMDGDTQLHCVLVLVEAALRGSLTGKREGLSCLQTCVCLLENMLCKWRSSLVELIQCQGRGTAPPVLTSSVNVQPSLYNVNVSEDASLSSATPIDAADSSQANLCSRAHGPALPGVFQSENGEQPQKSNMPDGDHGPTLPPIHQYFLTLLQMLAAILDAAVPLAAAKMGRTPVTQREHASSLSALRFDVLCQCNAQVQLMCLSLQQSSQNTYNNFRHDDCAVTQLRNAGGMAATQAVALENGTIAAHEAVQEVVPAGVQAGVQQARQITVQDGDRSGVNGAGHKITQTACTPAWCDDPFSEISSNPSWAQLLYTNVSSQSEPDADLDSPRPPNSTNVDLQVQKTTPTHAFERREEVSILNQVPHVIQHTLASAVAWLTPGLPCWWGCWNHVASDQLHMASCSFLAPELLSSLLMDMLVSLLSSCGVGQTQGGVMMPAAIQLVQLVAEATAHVTSPVSQLILLENTMTLPHMKGLQRYVEGNPALARSAKKALIALSNQMAGRPEFAGAIAMSQASVAQHVAEAARKLLPFALLTPSIFLEHFVADAVHHVGQQGLVIRLLSTFRPITEWRQPQQHRQERSPPTHLLFLLLHYLLPASDSTSEPKLCLTQKTAAALETLMTGLIDAKLVDPKLMMRYVLLPAVRAGTQLPEEILLGVALTLLNKLLEHTSWQEWQEDAVDIFGDLLSPAARTQHPFTWFALHDVCSLSTTLLEEALLHGDVQSTNILLAHHAIYKLMQQAQAPSLHSQDAATQQALSGLLESAPWPLACMLLPLVTVCYPDNWQQRVIELLQQHRVTGGATASVQSLTLQACRLLQFGSTTPDHWSSLLHCLRQAQSPPPAPTVQSPQHKTRVVGNNAVVDINVMSTTTQRDQGHQRVTTASRAETSPQTMEPWSNMAESAVPKAALTYAADILCRELVDNIKSMGLMQSRAALLAAICQVLPLAPEAAANLLVDSVLPHMLQWMNTILDPIQHHEADDTRSLQSARAELEACCTALLLFVKQHPLCRVHPEIKQAAADRCIRQVGRLVAGMILQQQNNPVWLLAYCKQSAGIVLGAMRDLVEDVNCKSFQYTLLALIPQAITSYVAAAGALAPSQREAAVESSVAEQHQNTLRGESEAAVSGIGDSEVVAGAELGEHLDLVDAAKSAQEKRSSIGTFEQGLMQLALDLWSQLKPLGRHADSPAGSIHAVLLRGLEDGFASVGKEVSEEMEALFV